MMMTMMVMTMMMMINDESMRSVSFIILIRIGILISCFFFQDYVLAYQEYSDKATEWQEKRADKRKHFQERLEEQGLELEQEDCDVNYN